MRKLQPGDTNYESEQWFIANARDFMQRHKVGPQRENEPLVCSSCKRPIELSADIEHYEDTGMLCDRCLADKLGIA